MPDGSAKSQEVQKRPEAPPQRLIRLIVLKRLEDTRTRAMKAPVARAPLAAMITEEKQEASPLAGARASAAAAHLAAAAVGIDDRIWRDALCSERI
jgi:hypothetical protein